MATRVAVIGVGSMGRNHARVYSELPDAELAAVSDANEAVASGIGAQFGVRAYSDYRAMLSAEKPEAVSIAVPTALHEEIALAALEAGAHILVEKPIAATVQEGQTIIRKAAEAKRVLMVGHIVRFNPAIQALKQKLQDGDLGKIFQVFCRRAGPFPARIRDVGVVVDLAPHDVDIMRFLTGKDPERVFAETEQRIHTDHEDLLFGLLRFPDRITGALEINWLTPTKLREVLVLGERGMFRVDDLTQDLYFYENAQANNGVWPALATLKGVSEGSMIRFALQRYEPLKAELQAFLKAVRGEAPVAVSGEDGLAALRLALALVESGEKHQVIEV
ncbi:MAG: Gfo/Idh/MocA family oxidoreductase [Anaerolineae bacterium]|nr:Gfo/Idh/MocA family oxidoreductase [Anaerolineae bacterium]